jgi:hypothetical protein
MARKDKERDGIGSHEKAGKEWKIMGRHVKERHEKEWKMFG